jgi:hypothetical protein
VVPHGNVGVMWLPWNYAAVMAAVVAVAVAVVQRHPPAVLRPSRVEGMLAFFREVAVILGLYALWQLAGTLSVMKVTGALARGRHIWDLERTLHLPSELWFQRLALPHSLFVQACNIYYAVVHVPALGVFLVWLFFRHRREYPHVRNVLAMLTGASLLIQLIPVAPPRMLQGLGFVDTALVYKQSVYTALGRGAADQLSAMPSVHVGWAVVIGLAAVTISRSRWRWLVLLHPVVTVLVVVVTANHYWLDGIAELGVLAVAIAVEYSVVVLARRLRSPADLDADADLVRV